MNFKLLSIASAFCLTAFTTQSLAEDKRPISMACAQFPPYKIKAPTSDAKHYGIDLDVMRQAFLHAGRDVKFEFYPWKRTVEMVKRGQADGLCGCDYRPEREQHFIYSDLLGTHSQGVFIKDESNMQIIENLDDLSEKTVAVVRGYAVQKELEKQNNLTVVETSDDRQLLKLLLANRVDAIYSYRDIILYRMSFSVDTKKIRYFEFQQKPYYLCFTKMKADISDVVNDFNKGLRTIRFNGKYQEIWDNYR